MVINVNLTGRVMLPYIPDYIRNSKEKIKEEEKAYVVLKDINYGFVENLKARQIELFKKLNGENGKTNSNAMIESTSDQIQFVKKIWDENVVGFVGLENQQGEVITKEMVEGDAILFQDMLSSLAIEINFLADTLRVERVSKK
ncbi:hypothetical protein [Borreliella burgdorferi]|uniref:hypothetical protein n=1 Tax=Borreliella burgdorferi TaxID=139 RepID=UPI000D02CF75|nr:hypothetical protein [Borreliella burgdorferi]PRQ89730.1 hypothetical protein CV697_04995 [Borreliella burgdorferi]PRQ94717.1 hypothetical protein CV684_05530 [Borreliella burgdorferi]PRR17219.1 hypothetical protein CV651_04780 [Borreliella burgdorferi]PRR31958.1 hypothetical protein CV692_04965 [Borreliella burgdorferi]PRR33146.1 hypothetical protein CV693_04900 [Borreliella burgdorferi]